MILETRRATFSIVTALCCAVMLVTLNPLVVGLVVGLDFSRVIYLLVFDAILLICCVALLRYCVTGRFNLFVWPMAVLSTLPILLPAFEMTDAYFRLNGASAQHQTQGANRLFEPDPLLGWVHPADAAIFDPDFDVTYDTDHERRKKMPQAAGTRKSTLHFFGDSFIFGYGVSNRDTALNLLASDLHDRYNLLNYAVVGSGLEQMFIRFRSNAQHVKRGDVVVFAPLTEDLQRNLIVGKAYVCNHVLEFGVGVQSFPVFRNGGWEFPSISDECPLLQTLLFHSRYPVGGLYKRAYAKVMTTFRRQRMLQNADEIFGQAKRLAEQSGASFMLLFMVRPDECIASSFTVDPSALRSQSSSLMPYCPRHAADAKKLQYRDGHWNIKGNLWAAQSMERVLAVSLTRNTQTELAQ